MRYFFVSLTYFIILQIGYIWPNLFILGFLSGFLIILLCLVSILKEKYEKYIIKRLILIIFYILSSLIYIALIDDKFYQQGFIILSWFLFNIILYLYIFVKNDKNLFIYSAIYILYILFIFFSVIYKLLIFFDLMILYLFLIVFSSQVLLYIHKFSLIYRDIIENLQVSFIFAFIISEIFWVLCFWPVSFYVRAGILTISCYIIMEIIYLLNNEKITRKCYKPVLYGVIIMIVIVWSAEWL
jgi:hypothetical protein